MSETTFGRRDIVEDVAATILMAATVLGFTATHEGWDVWLIGDSRRWATGLLTVLAAGLLLLVTRHIGRRLALVLGVAAAACAGVAFWTVVADCSS